MNLDRHFGKGSIQPSFPNDDQLCLYSMRFCPFAHRVHLVLNAKKIPYHTVYINLSEKPEWYAKVNPNGKVPALQLSNEPQHQIMLESMSIVEYLDEKYPDVKLYPTNSTAKADTNLWIERFDLIADTFERLVYNIESTDENDRLLNVLYEKIFEYESELMKRKTQYFAGTKPGIFDYAIWPWFERFGILGHFFGDKYHFDDRFPHLAMWSLLIRDEDLAVKKHLMSTVLHTKFALGRREGKPNYDLLIDEACSTC